MFNVYVQPWWVESASKWENTTEGESASIISAPFILHHYRSIAFPLISSLSLSVPTWTTATRLLERFY